MTPLEKVACAVADKVPERRGYEFGTMYCSLHGFNTDSKTVVECSDCRPETDTISLEDVLVAFDIHPGELREFSMNAYGEFFLDLKGEPVAWHLNKPLHEQSPETISFLEKILCES